MVVRFVILEPACQCQLVTPLASSTGSLRDGCKRSGWDRLRTIGDFVACLRTGGRALLVAAGFKVRGGAGEIVGDSGSGCLGSIVARFALSASLVGAGDPLKGNLSAFASGLSSSSIAGAATSV